MAVAHLQLVQGVLSVANLVQSYTQVAAQHTGALVDVQAAPEVVLCHLILLLPEVYLPNSIPAGHKHEDPDVMTKSMNMLV